MNSCAWYVGQVDKSDLQSLKKKPEPVVDVTVVIVAVVIVAVVTVAVVTVAVVTVAVVIVKLLENKETSGSAYSDFGQVSDWAEARDCAPQED